MKNKKIACSLFVVVLLAVTLLLPTSNVQAASKFPDVPSTHWAYNYVDDIASKGIISGFPDGTFRPNSSVTREQAAKMIVIAAGIPYKGKVSKFPDVSNDNWASPFVAAAKDAGVIGGFPDGTFRPKDKVTRAQVAAMVTKAFDLKLVGKASSFKDVPKTHWAKGSIEILTSNKIVSGYKDGTYKPNNPIKRAEFSKIISNALGSGLSDVEPVKDPTVYRDLKIKESGYSYKNGKLYYGYILTNPNTLYAVEFPAVRVTARDAKGHVLSTSDRLSIIIYPQQDYVDADYFYEISEKPATVEFSVVPPSKYFIKETKLLEHPTYKPLKVINTSVKSTSYWDTLLGEVSNPNNYDIDYAKITILYRDSNNKIIGGEYTLVEYVPANGKAPFEKMLWLELNYKKIEVYATTW